MDLLGFEALLSKEGAADIYNLLKTFHGQAISLQERILGTQSHRYRIHILSDCIFKTLNMTDHQSYEYSALLVSSDFSYNVIAQGTLFYNHQKLLRGAITYGQYYSDQEDSILFGPAVSRAYIIESKHTIYPRISIDPILIDTLHKELLPNYPFEVTDNNVTTGTEEDFLKSLYSWITKGDDGVWFVDYFRNFRFWFPYDEDPCEFISMHKQYIEEALRLAEANGKDDLIMKYLWLGNYHNKTIKHWLAVGWDKSLEGFDSEKLSVVIPTKFT